MVETGRNPEIESKPKLGPKLYPLSSPYTKERSPGPGPLEPDGASARPGDGDTKGTAQLVEDMVNDPFTVHECLQSGLWSFHPY